MAEQILEDVVDWCFCVAKSRGDEYLHELQLRRDGSALVRSLRIIEWLRGNYHPDDFQEEEDNDPAALFIKRESARTTFIERILSDTDPIWAEFMQYGDQRHPLDILQEDQEVQKRLEASKLNSASSANERLEPVLDSGRKDPPPFRSDQEKITPPLPSESAWLELSRGPIVNKEGQPLTVDDVLKHLIDQSNLITELKRSIDRRLAQLEEDHRRQWNQLPEIVARLIAQPPVSTNAQPGPTTSTRLGEDATRKKVNIRDIFTCHDASNREDYSIGISEESRYNSTPQRRPAGRGRCRRE